MSAVASSRRVVICSRYSSDLQRTESCDTQERVVREHLNKIGIDSSKAPVLRDEAMSGLRNDRPGSLDIKRLVDAGQISVLAVYEQSRLSRGYEARKIIQDLQFYRRFPI